MTRRMEYSLGYRWGIVGGKCGLPGMGIERGVGALVGSRGSRIPNRHVSMASLRRGRWMADVGLRFGSGRCLGTWRGHELRAPGGLLHR